VGLWKTAEPARPEAKPYRRCRAYFEGDAGGVYSNIRKNDRMFLIAKKLQPPSGRSAGDPPAEGFFPMIAAFRTGV
jgi:hypothetical protein